jgi:hypothetical protein
VADPLTELARTFGYAGQGHGPILPAKPQELLQQALGYTPTAPQPQPQAPSPVAPPAAAPPEEVASFAERPDNPMLELVQLPGGGGGEAVTRTTETSRTSTEGVEEREQQAALVEQQGAEGQQAYDEAAERRQLQLAQERQALEDRRRRDEERDAEIVARMNEATRKREELADRRVSPDALFGGDGSTVSTITTAIGFALASVLAAAVPGVGVGLALATASIKGAIDRNVEDQVRRKSDLLQAYTSELGDLDSARSLLKEKMYQDAALRADIFAAQLPDPEKAAKAATIATDLKSRAAQIRAESLESTRHQVRSVVQRQQTPGGGGPQVMTVAAADRAQAMQLDGIDPKKFEKLETDYTTLTTQEQTFNNLSTKVRMYSQGNDVPGFGEFAGRVPAWATSEQGRELRQLYQEAVTKFIQSISGATVSDKERAHLEDIIKGRGDLRSLQRGIEIMNKHNRNAVAGMRGNYQATTRVLDAARQRGARPDGYGSLRPR